MLHADKSATGGKTRPGFSAAPAAGRTGPAPTARKSSAPLPAAAATASMRSMFAHITALEAPIVWLAFAAGIAVGAFAAFLLLHRRAADRS
jgi:hypothetical protein